MVWKKGIAFLENWLEGIEREGGESGRKITVMQLQPLGSRREAGTYHPGSQRWVLAGDKGRRSHLRGMFNNR